jgi:hypothetical protein
MAADANNDTDLPNAGDAPAAETGATESRGSARARPTVTIDLTAEEVPPAARRPASTEPPPRTEDLRATTEAKAEQQPASGSPRGSAAGVLTMDDGLRRTLLAGLAGGVIAVAIALILQAVGILPAPGRTAARQALEQAQRASDKIDALGQRLSAVEAMTEAIPGMRRDLKSLSDTVTSLDALRPATASRGDLDALSATVTALAKRVDEAPVAATRDDLNGLAQRLGRLEATAAAGGDGQTASAAALASLTSQINQAQADVRALADKVTAEARPALTAGEDAVRAVAVSSLRRASSDGKPFAADVDMIANLGIDGGDIAIIRPLAAKGVATVSDLAAGFPDVASAILSATATADPNANFFQRVLASLGSLVHVRPLGPVAGSDPAAIVSRMSDDVTKGDIAAALAERAALPDAGKAASADWAAKAADRVALDQAVDRLARAAAAKAG